MHSPVDDLYLRTMLGCVHEQKAQGVRLTGVANKNTVCGAHGPYKTIQSIMEQVFFLIIDSLLVLTSHSGP